MMGDTRTIRKGTLKPVTSLETQILQVVSTSGLTGSGGADATHVHTQMVAATEWYILHNLNKLPAVTIIDTAGSEVIGDVFYVNLNTVKINLTAAMSGTASLN